MSSCPAICDILGIRLNDLFGIAPQDRLKPHEKSLIRQYRAISPVNRSVIDRIIHTILEEETLAKDKMLDDRILMLDRISTAAAAGNGFSFSDIPVDDYCFVFRDDRNERADGIIRVEGKSMEPVYHDGQSVYVEYTQSVTAGEDVICSSSEGVHIKRLGEETVYSLNKECPFQPGGEIRILGRVLGIVSSKDYPDQEEKDALEEIRHDEILEFKREARDDMN